MIKKDTKNLIHNILLTLYKEKAVSEELFSQELLARREMQPFKESILEAISWCEANNKNISASSKNGRQMSLK